MDSAYTAQLLAACAAARASAAGSEATKVAARDAYNDEYTAFKKQHRPASKIAPAVRNHRPIHGLHTVRAMLAWCLSLAVTTTALIVRVESDTKLMFASAGGTASEQFECSC